MSYYYDDDDDLHAALLQPWVTWLDQLNQQWKNAFRRYEGLYWGFQNQIQIPAMPVPPQLAIPATKEECVTAAEEIIAHCRQEVLRISQSEEIKSEHANFERVVQELAHAVRRFDSQYWKCERSGYTWMGEVSRDKFYDEDLKRGFTAIEDSERVLRDWKEDVERRQSVELKTRLQKVVEGQAEGLREWFMGQEVYFDHHVTLDKTHRERVVLEAKRPPSLSSRDGKTSLSNELMI